MIRLVSLVSLPLTLFIAGCSAQGQQVVKELENMPGLTCVTDKAGQTTCGPDTLQEAEQATRD